MLLLPDEHEIISIVYPDRKTRMWVWYEGIGWRYIQIGECRLGRTLERRSTKAVRLRSVGSDESVTVQNFGANTGQQK
jgi:hypothetical protein